MENHDPICEEIIMNDSRTAEQLAARLDEVLPPGTYDIFDTPMDEPEIQVAVRIARAPRPVIASDTRRTIEHQMRARADTVFGVPARFSWRRGGLGRWAAACLLMVMVAAAVLIAFDGTQDDRLPPSENVVHVQTVPSSPHTSVYIPDDAIVSPARLTVTGGGSSSLFISPGG
jgi:hypothetical protein